jgi:hypothetical protein
MGLGGFRIEVTVKAPGLHEASRAVRRTGFLDPQYWLGLGDGPHAQHLISAKLVEREAFLENAKWVYQQAVSAKVFQGQAGDKPSKKQVQALTDILNALGLHGGLRSPTKSLRSIRRMIRSGPSSSWAERTPPVMVCRARTTPMIQVTATKQQPAIQDPVLYARLLSQAATGGHHPLDSRVGEPQRG